MTAADLFRNLKLRCVTLWTDGNKLRWKPKAAVTPAELADLANHKAAIIALLLAEQLKPRAEQRQTRKPAIPAADPASLAWLQELIADGRADAMPGFQLRPGEKVADVGTFARALEVDLTRPTTSSRRRLALEDVSRLQAVHEKKD